MLTLASTSELAVNINTSPEANVTLFEKVIAKFEGSKAITVVFTGIAAPVEFEETKDPVKTSPVTFV